jgi:UPF0716 family protein affecting phage T7 exclusion
LLVMLRVLVRNQWLAALLFVLIFAGPKVLASSHMPTDALVWGSIYAIAAVAVVRLGFIVRAIGSFMADVLLNLPYTLDFSNWYASHFVFIVFHRRGSVGLLCFARRQTSMERRTFRVAGAPSCF